MRTTARAWPAFASVMLVVILALPVSAADRDRDGLRDGFETRWGVTDPDVRDSDRDGVVDSAEDSDGDGLGNLGEQRFRTNPSRRDTDRDGLSDAREDHDRDGRSNAREQDQRPLPANLKPTIRAARDDFPPIRFRCQTEQGRSKPVACSFGAKDAATRIVLMGDSHAMMWSSPIRAIAEAKGWRLTVMTKTACPPLIGLHVRGQIRRDGGVSCRTWRRNVIERLRANPPALVILASSDRYPLHRRDGSVYPVSSWPDVWKQALEWTITAMPARSQVLMLGDVPHNLANPRTCLRDHPRDMSACVSPRAPAGARPIERALREAARAKGGKFATLFFKICSYDPCPVVQGHILMWRDTSHVTDTFAMQLRPAMRAILERTVPRPAQAR